MRSPFPSFGRPPPGVAAAVKEIRTAQVRAVSVDPVLNFTLTPLNATPLRTPRDMLNTSRAKFDFQPGQRPGQRGMISPGMGGMTALGGVFENSFLFYIYFCMLVIIFTW